MPRDQFLHVRIGGAFELARVGPAEPRTDLFQKIDLTGNGYSFGICQAVEPFLKFVAAFDLPCHARNITRKA